MNKKKVIIYLLSSLLFLCYCGGNDETKPESISAEEDFDKSDYDEIKSEKNVKYYLKERYNYKTKKDYFDEKDKIKIDELRNYGRYMKVYYDDNGKVKLVKDIRGNQTAGYRKYFYNGNHLKKVIGYVDNNKESIGYYKNSKLYKVKRYNNNGKLVEIGRTLYKKGKRIQKWYKEKELVRKIYFNRKGNITQQIEYNNGQKEIVNKYYYSKDGQLSEQKSYKDGKLVGFVSYFYDKYNNLAISYLYRGDNVKQINFYYKDGNIRKKENYNDKGKTESHVLYSYSPTGKTKERFFTSANKLMYTNIYDKENRKISSKRFHNNRIIEEINYVYKNSSKTPSESQTYRNNTLVKTTEYDTYGRKTVESNYKAGNVDHSLKFFYIGKSNRLKTVKKYVDDRYDSKWTYSYNKKNKIKAEKYIKRSKTLTSRNYEYYSNGNLKLIEDYQNGKIHSRTIFNELGKEEEALRYKNNQLIERVIMEYNNKGLKDTENIYDGNNNLLYYTVFEYDKNNRNFHQIGYHAEGKIVWERYFYFDSNGNKIQEVLIDSKGEPVERIFYDTLGNPIKTINLQKQKKRKVEDFDIGPDSP